MVNKCKFTFYVFISTYQPDGRLLAGMDNVVHFLGFSFHVSGSPRSLPPLPRPLSSHAGNLGTKQMYTTEQAYPYEARMHQDSKPTALRSPRSMKWVWPSQTRRLEQPPPPACHILFSFTGLTGRWIGCLQVVRESSLQVWKEQFLREDSPCQLDDYQASYEAGLPTPCPPKCLTKSGPERVIGFAALLASGIYCRPDFILELSCSGCLLAPPHRPQESRSNASGWHTAF